MNIDLLMLDDTPLDCLVERLGFGESAAQSSPELRSHMKHVILEWLKEQEALEPPSIVNELSRKTLETAAWSFDRVADGEISEAEHRAAMQAIFGVTAGLLDREIQTLINDIPREASAKAVEKRVFRRDKHVLILSWVHGSCRIHAANFIKAEIGANHARTFESPAEARNEFQKLVEGLLKKGFELV